MIHQMRYQNIMLDIWSTKKVSLSAVTSDVRCVSPKLAPKPRRQIPITTMTASDSCRHPSFRLEHSSNSILLQINKYTVIAASSIQV